MPLAAPAAASSGAAATAALASETTAKLAESGILRLWVRSRLALYRSKGRLPMRGLPCRFLTAAAVAAAPWPFYLSGASGLLFSSFRELPITIEIVLLEVK